MIKNLFPPSLDRPRDLKRGESDEPRDDGSCAGFRVQLTNPSDEHSPSYSSAETHHVRVDRTTCLTRSAFYFQRTSARTFCPEFDSSKRVAKDGNIGYESEDFICYAGATKRSDAAFVEVA